MGQPVDPHKVQMKEVYQSFPGTLDAVNEGEWAATRHFFDRAKQTPASYNRISRDEGFYVREARHADLDEACR